MKSSAWRADLYGLFIPDSSARRRESSFGFTILNQASGNDLAEALRCVSVGVGENFRPFCCGEFLSVERHVVPERGKYPFGTVLERCFCLQSVADGEGLCGGVFGDFARVFAGGEEIEGECGIGTQQQ